MIHSLILRTATRVVVPLILVFSVYLLTWGHHDSGGGFSAGLIAALAFALYASAYGTRHARRALRFEPIQFIGAGLASALLAGIIPLAAGRGFLGSLWTEVRPNEEVRFELGTPFLFDFGVYLIVAGTMLAMILEFEEAFTSILPQGDENDD